MDKATVVRKDTGEVAQVRAMTNEEVKFMEQGNLPLEVPPAPEKPKAKAAKGGK
jgi:hypothetical protein